MTSRLLGIVMGSVLTITMAAAQTPPSGPATTPPAIATHQGDVNKAAAPVPGKNSFTEGEARSRLEQRGYTEITNLALDDQSIWRGKATKDGKPVAVAVDYQGNVFGQ